MSDKNTPTNRRKPAKLRRQKNRDNLTNIETIREEVLAAGEIKKYRTSDFYSDGVLTMERIVLLHSKLLENELGHTPFLLNGDHPVWVYDMKEWE